MRSIFLHALALPIALFVGVGACSQIGTSTALIPETALMVDPGQFLGKVTCGSGPGTMQRYVATIVDVSGFDRSVSLPAHARLEGGVGVLVLPSSEPTSCFVSVLFERIVIGRQYAADIDGYDRTDIEPVAPGSRVMVDSVTKEYVPPRWRTTCSSHWSDPRRRIATASDGGRSADGGLRADAGNAAGGSDASTEAGSADAGAFDSSPAVTPPLPATISVEGRPDAVAPYGTDCRGHRYLDGGPSPWLNGPLCALQYETIVFKGCDALTEIR